MRLSEVVTIYLAAAAPAGVAQFLRQEPGAHRRARSVARAAAVALAWPFTLAALWLRASRRMDVRRLLGDGPVVTPNDQSAQALKRALCEALRRIEEAAGEELIGAGAKRRGAAWSRAREVVECYVGLALAAREAHWDAAPDAREMELCRVAGRRGEDLLLAGRCVHRNNVARLRAHHARARVELLHTLSALCEQHIEAGAAGANTSQPHGLTRHVHQARALAAELFAAVGDREAAAQFPHPIGTARAFPAGEAGASPRRAPEGETCQFTSAQPPPPAARVSPQLTSPR